jgi:hypothetical protein
LGPSFDGGAAPRSSRRDQKIRPDWNIDTPDMRERWNAGQRQCFWPYGKSLRQALVRMTNAVDLYDKSE